jgi:phage shock protein PspC (stress-responsive transcriptional regulator)
MSPGSVGDEPGCSPILRARRRAEHASMTTNPIDQSEQTAFPLRRPYEGRILAGVASGIAEYLAVEVAVVRIGLVVLSLLGGLGVPVYLAGWLFIADEGAPVPLAEQWLHHHQRRAV